MTGGHRWIRILGGCISLLPLFAAAAHLEVTGQGENSIDGCRIQVSRDHPRTYYRGGDGQPYGTFEQLAAHLAQQGEQVICATNAGIYGKDLRPIGLYIENRYVARRLNTRREGYGNFYMQPNGVFVIGDQGAAIHTTDEFAANQEVLQASARYATQSGPMLLQRGAINPLFVEHSENRLVRNGVCIISADEIVLVRSKHPINFYAFARQLRDGWRCSDALYLDGTISRLYPLDSSALGIAYSGFIAVTKSMDRARP